MHISVGGLKLTACSAARKRRPFNCCQNCYMGLWRDVQRVVQRRAARPEFAITRKIPIQLADFLRGALAGAV